LIQNKSTLERNRRQTHQSRRKYLRHYKHIRRRWFGQVQVAIS